MAEVFLAGGLHPERAVRLDGLAALHRLAGLLRSRQLLRAAGQQQVPAERQVGPVQPHVLSVHSHPVDAALVGLPALVERVLLDDLPRVRRGVHHPPVVHVALARGPVRVLDVRRPVLQRQVGELHAVVVQIHQCLVGPLGVGDPESRLGVQCSLQDARRGLGLPGPEPAEQQNAFTTRTGRLVDGR